MGKKIISLVVAGCGCGMLMYAQSNSNVNSMDRTFMDKAAQGGIAEVQLGQLAQQKASSQAVKDFGAKMVHDHTMVNDQLMMLASKQGVNLPTSMNAKDQAEYNKLSGMSGGAFDRAYMQAMLKDHRMDIAEFNKESEKAKDPQLKSLVTMTLPTLQQHLQLARQVDSQIGTSATR